ncbi:hypothetical protein [Streptomyces bacillaris]|uniref:hypothetical protein n=1 Tax=Streptomyces bacillaris TaxID=68179 RepID=UPI003639679A
MISTDEYNPTGPTGDRDLPPVADRMAEAIRAWDTTTPRPRTDGEYLVLAMDLLALDEDGRPDRYGMRRGQIGWHPVG